jgi:tRNA dimethylallyltransferase
MKPKIALQTTRKLITIVGPTAVGKTALSVLMAKRFDGVIISADSRQVYRGMDLGTGKVTKREMGGVPHFLLDVASPKTQYTVAKYQRDVLTVLKKIPDSTPIFLVGGSPFYIEAILNPTGISTVPPNPRLRKQLANWSTARLFAELKKRDPKRATTIDQANPRRLIRAIEIARGTPTIQSTPLPPFDVLRIGKTLPTKKLFPQIDRRVDRRMKQGMVREVEQLHEGGVSWKKLESFGLEYRFLSLYLQGKLTKAEAVMQLKSAIHYFSRRQMTWWKRDQSIHWIKSEAQAVKLIQSFLKK